MNLVYLWRMVNLNKFEDHIFVSFVERVTHSYLVSLNWSSKEVKKVTVSFDFELIKKGVSVGSKYWTSPDFKWAKQVEITNSLYFEWYLKSRLQRFL